MNWKFVHRVWALIWCPRKLRSGAQTLCIATLLLAWTTNPARADCPAAPIADPDDMAISFLAANGVQAASASVLASTVKEGTLVYDDSADKLKVCDGNNWIDVGSGNGTDTLTSLSCTAGQIAKFDGSDWACAADGGGAATPVSFSVNKNGTNQTVTSGVATKVTFASEAFDTNNNFASDRFTATAPGKYLFNGSAACASATTYCRAMLYKNGAVVADQLARGSDNYANVVAILDLSTADYVELYASAGGGTVLSGDAARTFFDGALLSAQGSGTDTLAALSCSTNEIPKWDGSDWVCTADSVGGSAPVAFSVTKTVNQTVTPATWTKITWNNEGLDSDNSFDLVTGRFQPNVAGLYQLNGSVQCFDNNTYCGVSIFKNGAVVHTAIPSTSASNPTIVSIASAVYLDGSTDYVELWGLNSTGVTLRGVPTYTYFNGFLVGGSGGSDTLADLSCATNEIPKWNGTAWACAADGSGSGSGSTGFEYFAGSTLLVGNITYHSVTPSNNYPVTVPPGTKAVKLYVHYNHGSSTTNTHGYLSFLAYQKGQTAANKRATYASQHFDDYANSDIAYLDIPWEDSLDDEVTIQVTSSHNTDALNRYNIYFAGYVVGGGDTLAGLTCSPNEIPKWSGSAWACAADGNDGGASMTGAVMAFNASTCPTGWTEFTPARGRFLRGIDNGAGNDPDGTRAPGDVQDDAFQAHRHFDGGLTYVGGSGEAGGVDSDTGWPRTQRSETDGTIEGGGGTPRTSTETRPQNVAVIFCQYNGTGGVGGGGATNPVAFSVNKNGTNQTITANVEAVVTWSTEEFDTNNNFASNRFMPSVAGQYHIDLSVYVVSGVNFARIYKNGTMVAEGYNPGSNAIVPASVTVDMNGTTDYIEARVYSSGTTLEGLVKHTYMQGFLVGGGGGSDTLSGLSCSSGEIPKWDGTAWACAADDGGTATAAGDEGQIQFNDGSDAFAADAALHWDNTNKRLGIGTATPRGPLHVTPVGGTVVTNSELSSTTQDYHIGSITDTGLPWTALHLQGASGSSVVLWDNHATATPLTTSALKFSTAVRSTTNENAAVLGSIYVQRSSNDPTTGGALIFRTRSDGDASTSNPPERMRITSDGRIALGDGIVPELNKLSIYTVGHVSDGGNDYGLTISSFEPAITLLDRTTGAGQSQIFGGNDGSISLRHEVNSNDGTIGHSTNTNWKQSSVFSADSIKLFTLGAERLRITSAGNVGVGSASPASMLHVAGGIQIGDDASACPGPSNIKLGAIRFSSGALQVCLAGGWSTVSSASGAIAGTGSANHIAFWSGTNALVHDASQLYWDAANNRLGIGTGAPERALHILGEGGISDDIFVEANSDSLATNSGGLMFLRSRGTALAKTSPLAEDLLGLISNRAWTGSAYETAAEIAAIAETDYTPGRSAYMAFRTRSAGSYAERMRIASNGNVGIGTTSPGAKLSVSNGYVEIEQTAGTPVRIGSDSSRGYISVLNASKDFTIYTSSAQRLTVKDNGNVGIGTAAPLSKLAVEGLTDSGSYSSAAGARFADGNLAVNLGGSSSGNYGWIQGTNQGVGPGKLVIQRYGGNVGIGTVSPSYALHVAGQVAGAGAYVNTSDARLKRDVRDLDHGLDTVMRLRPVSFQWKTQTEDWQKGRKLGLIAQEVEKVTPEIVSTASDEMHTKSIAYGDLTPVLIKAVQELKADNDNLRAELEAANDNYEALRREIDTLKAQR